MITVVLYMRQNCHLCDEAKEELAKLQTKFPHNLVEIDIDNDRELSRTYGNDVPIIEVGPYRIKPPYTPQEIEMTLGAATDRKNQLESLNTTDYQDKVNRGKTWSKIDAVTYWFSRHYLLVFNLFVVIYVGIPFLAPVLMRSGATTPAAIIYRAYGTVCHQLAFRSFFLFGEQWVYPRSAAGWVNLLNFQSATGLSEDSNPINLYNAHNFVGNTVVGFKVALCERDVAIYLAILLFGLIYSLTDRRLPALHWAVWIAIGIIPIGLDGFSQLLSQPPFNLLPYRESTPYLRILTGALFGFTTAWFGYPMVEITMADTRTILASKFLRLTKKQITQEST
jgi:uncharacterized membrane protein/thiol-disulfide isomerase/thioredoxin